MNIQEAKQEVIHTVRAYTAKDSEGSYRIPRIRQRPVLLMGPPGIGKTAVVEQAAAACGVGLVAYTITHHTRQSAVGLPMIEKKEYEGREVSVTEYTMSEIIASVYDCMEQTGCREGILFIDEINCVSETLAPTMLQFLQAKTFGNHRVPDGWVIVAAGNPPEYNRSVRDFDIVTLDRVKRLDIDADYPAWKSYAVSRGIHGAIRSYLEHKPQCFYYLEQTPEDSSFVTARGWEDLSVILKAYEEMDVPADENLVRQYLQCEEIAGDFAAYYTLYTDYGRRYGENFADILQGKQSGTRSGEELHFRPDEQLTVVNLLVFRVLDEIGAWSYREALGVRRREVEDLLIRDLRSKDLRNKDFRSKENKVPEESDSDAKQTEATISPIAVEQFFTDRRKALDIRVESGTVTEDEIRRERRIDGQIRDMIREATQPVETTISLLTIFEIAETQLAQKQEEDGADCSRKLGRMLYWILENFGDGSAFTVAMEILSVDSASMEILRRWECPVFMEHSTSLLIHDREKRLRERLEKLQNTSVISGE